MAGGTNKMRDIGTLLQTTFDKIVADLYLNKLLSSIEIADEIFQSTGIRITPRSIQRRLKVQGLLRSRSQTYTLAIKKGRRNFDSVKKNITSADLRCGISLKMRYEVFRRDNFRCIICGVTAKDTDLLVIDHIIPVVSGGGNTKDNLRVLCRACNHGKMLAEERHI
ncbi:MAG: HNH endonuclease signature motif containing protein [Candidatus Komeilibacteria bacterium]